MNFDSVLCKVDGCILHSESANTVTIQNITVYGNNASYSSRVVQGDANTLIYNYWGGEHVYTDITWNDYTEQQQFLGA